MSKVGEILKKRRELESKSLEDIAIQTMITKKYIMALEEGNYEIFPGKVYAKGFLRNYANSLGFDGDEINDLVSQYELEWQEGQFDLPTVSSKPEKILHASKINRALYMIIFILIICISGLLILYFTKQRVFFQQEPIIYPDPSKILEEEDISKAEDLIIKKQVEEIKKNNENEIKEQPVDIESKKVWLEVFASENVWMQATIDDKIRKEVFLEQDQKIKWQAQEKIFLTIGNAGGVVFKLNERYIGALGRKGEVKKVLVTASGVDVIKTHEAIQHEGKPKSTPPLSEEKERTSSLPTSPPTSTLTIEKQPPTTTTAP